MASLLFFLLPIVFLLPCGAQQPPSPGYYPTSQANSVNFFQGFRNLWGPQHQSFGGEGAVSIWLDSSSGSGFKSQRSYQSGYFGAAIKLQSGYTAGVITSLYLSNNEVYPGHHDEIDIEFLGTLDGQPYTLQTNVYIQGSGDGSNKIGREMRFHLWFDPTQGFHNYAIQWNPEEIIFFVDDIPIRRYAKKSEATFPSRGMWVYGTIWDASSWATEEGKYKANYEYQPFVAKYKDFKLGGNPKPGLTPQQAAAMAWVQSRYMVYNYCANPSRDRSRTTEC